MYPKASKSRTAVLAEGGFTFPVPVPANYIGVRKTATYDTRQQLVEVTFVFLPVTKRMSECTSIDLEKFIKSNGYDLITPDALVDGWRQYLPSKDQSDPPLKQITYERNESGFSWQLPETAILSKLMRLMRREGDPDAFDALPDAP